MSTLSAFNADILTRNLMCRLHWWRVHMPEGGHRKFASRCLDGRYRGVCRDQRDRCCCKETPGQGLWEEAESRHVRIPAFQVLFESAVILWDSKNFLVLDGSAMRTDTVKSIFWLDMKQWSAAGFIAKQQEVIWSKYTPFIGACW